MSASDVSASASAARTTGATSSRCRLDATSGTTPPKRAWRSACDYTIDDNTRLVFLETIGNPPVLDRRLEDLAPASKQVLALIGHSRQPVWSLGNLVYAVLALVAVAAVTAVVVAAITDSS